MLFWIFVVAAVIVLLAAIGYFLYRRRQRARMVSLVALTRSHRAMDPAILARIVQQQFKLDVGDGTNEGPDGFVVSNEILTTIFMQGDMILINSFPNTYVENVEEVANTMPDLRVRTLLKEHRAWFSCDFVGVDFRTSESEVYAMYGKLGRLFAQLLDDDCLLIYLPDFGLSFPINEETQAALLSGNPIGELQKTMEVPMIEIDSNHPAMKRAVEEAKQRLPEFLTAVEEGRGSCHSIKAPITVDDVTEFIWITLTCIEGGRVYGQIGNNPVNLGSLRLGSNVVVPVEDIVDWMHLDEQGHPVGGFSLKAIQAAQKK